jgi:hypothetical protein
MGIEAAGEFCAATSEFCFPLRLSDLRANPAAGDRRRCSRRDAKPQGRIKTETGQFPVLSGRA